MGLMQLIQDGWQNLITGMGIKNRDKGENSEFYLGTPLTDAQLIEIYRGEGIGAKMVDIIATDMTRAGYTVEGDTDNTMPKYLEAKGYDEAVRQALTWSRLFGGAIIVMGIDDGQKGDGAKILQSPIKEDQIQKVGFFRVYDKRQVTWQPTEIDNNPNSENYGKPLLYTVTPVNQSTKMAEFKVHYSRVLVFIGKDLPEKETNDNRGWGDSIIQAAYTRIKGFASSLINTEKILDEFIIGVLTVKGLGDIIAAGKEKDVATRMNIIDMTKHIMNTIVVDEDEEYQRFSATVNGIKDILEFLKDCLSAVSGIPQVKLFGEQSTGIGGKAEGNIRMYYDDIQEIQKRKLQKHHTRVCTLTAKSADFKELAQGKDYGKIIQIKFPSLWQMSETEMAEARKKISEADANYMDRGVISPATVAKSRFGGEHYSMEMVLNEAEDKTFREKMTKNMMETPKKEGAKDAKSSNSNS